MPKKVKLYHVYSVLFSSSVYVWEKPEKRRIRTFEIFKCPICGVLTNRALYIGFTFRSSSCRYRVEVFCPNSAKCWHHELEDKTKELSQVTPILSKFKLLTRGINKLLRSHKKGVKNDVVGRTGRLSVYRDVIRTRQCRRGCKHGFLPYPGLKIM